MGCLIKKNLFGSGYAGLGRMSERPIDMPEPIRRGRSRDRQGVTGDRLVG